jgi:hypothetical protein
MAKTFAAQSLADLDQRIAVADMGSQLEQAQARCVPALAPRCAVKIGVAHVAKRGGFEPCVALTDGSAVRL